MKHPDEIEKTILRARQYWFIDGLSELAFGGACLVLALFFYLQVIVPQDNLLAALLNSSLVLVIVAGTLLGRRVVHRLKARLTYPRTGYVSYPEKSGKNRWLAAGSAILMGAIMAALVVNEPASLAWMPAITGLLIGAVLLYSAYRFGLLRFYLLSATAVLTGPGLSLAGIGDLPGLVWFYALLSLALCISGGLTFRSYLKHNQPVREDAP